MSADVTYGFTTGVVHKGVIYKKGEDVPVAILKDKALQIYIAPKKPVIKENKKKR
jgi:hypothetical protein